jgi:hypothetical protein
VRLSLGRKLIASLNGQNYKVCRTIGSNFVDGIYEPIQVETSIFGTVQPVGGEDLVRIPEGDRKTDRLKIYTSDQLFTSSDSTSNAADIIIINEIQYQVESVERWPDYNKAVLVRFKQ